MIGATLAEATKHAVDEFPRESCGLVVIFKGKERYVRCRNVAVTPNAHFEMPGEDYAAAEDLGEVVELVHSHPQGSALPSSGDRTACEQSELRWTILAVHADEATGVPTLVGHCTIEPCGYEAPLVGREFSFGVNDCYTVIRDFYRRELGQELPDFERHDKFWERGEDLYMDNFQKAGFEPVTSGEMQVGDVVLMQIQSPIANHGGVYLGEGKMLHHMYGQLSTRVVYGGYWKEITRLVVRRRADA